MPKLTFMDLVRKKKFSTDRYRLVSKRTKRGMRYFAVAKAPSGNQSWLIVSRKFYNKFK